jgi:hypothetical protein
VGRSGRRLGIAEDQRRPGLPAGDHEARIGAGNLVDERFEAERAVVAAP